MHEREVETCLGEQWGASGGVEREDGVAMAMLLEGSLAWCRQSMESGRLLEKILFELVGGYGAQTTQSVREEVGRHRKEKGQFIHPFSNRPGHDTQVHRECRGGWRAQEKQKNACKLDGGGAVRWPWYHGGLGCEKQNACTKGSPGPTGHQDRGG